MKKFSTQLGITARTIIKVRNFGKLMGSKINNFVDFILSDDEYEYEA